MRNAVLVIILAVFAAGCTSNEPAVNTPFSSSVAEIKMELQNALSSGGISPESYSALSGQISNLESSGYDVAELRNILLQIPVGDASAITAPEKPKISADSGNLIPFYPGIRCDPELGFDNYRTDQTLAIDPLDPKIMYVNIEYRGIYKTIDGGENWKLISGGLKALPNIKNTSKPCYGQYFMIYIDHSNTQRILLPGGAAPGVISEVFTSTGGLHESPDGGTTWRQLFKGSMSSYIGHVVTDHRDPKIIYADTSALHASYTGADPSKFFVTKGVVYKTIDGGENWEELPTGFFPEMRVTGLFINYQNPDHLMITTMGLPPGNTQNKGPTAEQWGILETKDAGRTWTRIESTNNMGIRHPAVSSRNFNNIFFSGDFENNEVKFYSTDGGKTFRNVDVPINFARYDPYDPTGQRIMGFIIYTQPNDIYESTDGAKTWQPVGKLPAEVTNTYRPSGIVFDPKDRNTIYMNGDMGRVWKSQDKGKTWKLLLSVDMLGASNPAAPESQGAANHQPSSVITWYYNTVENKWKPSSPPPQCPDLTFESPADVAKATSVLNPGQVRGGDYKPHGGLRFDSSSSNIEVKAPFDAYVVDGARYIESGEVQYMFDFVNECGIMYRFDHLLELDAKFNALAEKLPEPKPDDSRTAQLEPFFVEKGDLIATKVGLTGNVFFDWGVYNLLEENVASQNPSYRSMHQAEAHHAFHAMCWFDMLKEPDRTTVKNLPANGVEGDTSDYC